jgi:acetyl esterase/lipase
MTAGIVSTRELAYAERSDGELVARVYRPAGPGPFQALIGIHGGGWVVGDRTTNEPVDRALAQDGILVVAIDFRQPPEDGYPASIADVNLAVRWVRAHADELEIRPASLGLFGTSSGGHIAMLCAMRPNFEKYRRNGEDVAQVADVDYVVMCAPVLDPLARYRFARETGNKLLVDYHDRYWANESAMLEGNPQVLLEKGMDVELPNVLIIEGTSDENLPPGMIERFETSYRARGGNIRVVWCPGMPHSFIQKTALPESVRAIAEIARFVRSQDQAAQHVQAKDLLRKE